MAQYLKASSFLFYILTSLGSFFLGVYVCLWTGAAENQMLAGGAIVLGYGIIGFFAGLVFALIIIRILNQKTVVLINKIIGLILIGLIVFLYFRARNKSGDTTNSSLVSLIAIEDQFQMSTAYPSKELAINTKFYDVNSFQLNDHGLGMFKPRIGQDEVLYFYNNPNFEKSALEHVPIDSITFSRNEQGSVSILTAPPWLAPEHLKLDYEILFFKAIGITDSFIELEVNRTNLKRSFVNKEAGKLWLWPEFFMAVHSVELKNEEQKIFIKPLVSSSEIVTDKYTFMKPIYVGANWMHVQLVNEDYEIVAKGWIKWIEQGQILINYSLLS